MSYISLPKKGLNDLSQTINKAKKFLIESYQQLINNKNHPFDYDGGVSIILALMKQKYNVDVGIGMECDNLEDCAKNFYQNSTSDYKFSVTDEDIFGEDFLKQLYLTNEPIGNYNHFVTKLQKYLNHQQTLVQLHNDQHKGLVSFFNVQNKTYYRIINVGLALVALESYHKAEINGNSQYQFLFKKVVKGLWVVFKNGLQLEEQYMDPMKAMSLWVLFMLNEVKKDSHLVKYIKCIIKEQASNGQWVNSDVFDGNNLVNDILLTSINLMNLIDYQTTKLPEHPEKPKHSKYVTLEPVYLDDNIKKQEYGLTAFQSKELFQNTDEMSPKMRTYLVLLGFFILALFLINNCKSRVK